MKVWLSTILALASLLLAGQAAWIPAKAWLAQQLLERAWAHSLQDGQNHKAWPWADHWPVARLEFPEQNQSFIVLEGDQGSALAFAPGHNPQSGLGQDSRRIIISGHRDTHFKLLGQLQSDEPVILHTRQGRHIYTIQHRDILDTQKDRLSLRADGQLILVTCWPINGLDPTGTLRLVLSAVPMPFAV